MTVDRDTVRRMAAKMADAEAFGDWLNDFDAERAALSGDSTPTHGDDCGYCSGGPVINTDCPIHGDTDDDWHDCTGLHCTECADHHTEMLEER